MRFLRFFFSVSKVISRAAILREWQFLPKITSCSGVYCSVTEGYSGNHYAACSLIIIPNFLACFSRCSLRFVSVVMYATIPPFCGIR